MTTPLSVTLTGQSLIHHDLRSVTDPRLDRIAQILKASAVTFTNLETTIFGRHGGWPLKGSYFGCSTPAVLDALQHLGFNSLSLANNHAFDLGPSGVLSTLEEVGAKGLLHAGVGMDRRQAHTIGKKVFGSWTVGLAAMDAGPGPAFMYAEDESHDRMARPGVNRLHVSRIFDLKDEAFDLLRSVQREFLTTPLEHANYAQPEDPPLLNDTKEINFYGTVFRRSDGNTRRIVVDRRSAREQLAAIEEEARRGTFVIAYLHHHHWEPRWDQAPPWVQDFAHDCIDAGARIFASHGAPVLQAIEIYRDAPIFYGLGNFLFHTKDEEQEWSPAEVWKSVVATCFFESDRRLREIELRPIVVGGTAALWDRKLKRLAFPVLAEGRMAKDILEDLADHSAGFDTVISIDNEVGRILL